jgi:hypothetical protein
MPGPLKYQNFPAGTYNTSKIFLQADPVTGALEKINLPTITTNSIGIYGNGTFSTNSAGADTTLSSFVIPANSLRNPGDYLEIIFLGQSLNAAVNKQWKLLIDGVTTTVYSSTNTGIYTLIVKFTLNTTGNTTIEKSVVRSGVVSTLSTTAASSINWTVNQTISFIAFSATASILEYWSTRTALIQQP